MTEVDVFISYRHKGNTRSAERIKTMLDNYEVRTWMAGHDLLGDQRTNDLPPEIETVARKAKCVLVLWSRSSIGRNWVIAEAKIGHGSDADRSRLVQLAIDDVDLSQRKVVFQGQDVHRVFNVDNEDPDQGFSDALVEIGRLLDRPGLSKLYALKGKPLAQTQQWARDYPEDRYAEAVWRRTEEHSSALFEKNLATLSKDKAAAIQKFEVDLNNSIDEFRRKLIAYNEKIREVNDLIFPNPLRIWNLLTNSRMGQMVEDAKKLPGFAQNYEMQELKKICESSLARRDDEIAKLRERLNNSDGEIQKLQIRIAEKSDQISKMKKDTEILILEKENEILKLKKGKSRGFLRYFISLLFYVCTATVIAYLVLTRAKL